MSDYKFDLERGFYRTRAGDRRQLREASLDLAALCPFLRSLVTADGSMTRFLESYTWEPINVVAIEHGECTGEHGERVLRRVVAMRGVESNLRYAAAASEMPIDTMPDELRPLLGDARRGLGQVIAMLQLDTHRRIRSLRREPAAHRAEMLQLAATASVLVREYEITRDQHPIAYVREVFPEERLHEVGTRARQ